LNLVKISEHMRPQLALALLLGLLGPGAAAETCTIKSGGCPKIENDLNTRKDLINTLKNKLEVNYKHLNSNGTIPTSAYFANSGRFATGNKSLDACGGELPSTWNPKCDRTYGGDTKGCECMGTSIVDHVVVKALDIKFDPTNARRNAGNLAAFAANDVMQKTYQDARFTEIQNKWMYFGAADGSYSLYPGRLWPRTDEDDLSKCGAKYDPRVRPWYLSAATGPKNVVFILDSSGSMSSNSANIDRMALLKTAAKKIVDALSFADFFGLVDFDTEARTFNNLNFLAPAGAKFRDEAKIWIDKLQAEGQTNYRDAIKRAWKMAVSWMPTMLGARYTLAI